MTKNESEAAPEPGGDHQDDALMHDKPLTQRIKNRAGVIFKDRRIYGRVRISTVALAVAFLAILWLYLAVRPPPTVGDGPPQPAPTSQNDAPTSAERTTERPSETTSETSTPTATPSSTPSETEPPGGRSGPQSTGEQNIPAPPAQTSESDADQ